MSGRCCLFYILALCLTALVACSPLEGTGSGGEAKIIGRILTQSGSPACSTVVAIAPYEYNAMISGPLPDPWIHTTDANGRYEFSVIKSDRYTIQAVHGSQRTRALVTGIQADQSVTVVPDAKLAVPGSIKIEISGNVDTVNGYVYIPGTDIAVSLRGTAGTVVFDSVPADTIPVIYYSTPSATAPRVIRYSLSVASGDTTPITMPFWQYSKQLFLNTTMSGAGVIGNVIGFPVLVRLTRGNFDFSQAKGKGEDVRFTKAGGAPLPYEIERWDSVGGQAEIWVKADTVYGNDDAQYSVMFWGNSTVADSSNSAAVFDTIAGFQGVWHLGQSANLVSTDATGNHYNGAASDSVPTAAAGVVGVCQAFNGTSNFIRMPGTASGKLNFPEQGTYAVSAWVYADTLDTANSNYAKIIEKNDFQYKLQVDCFKNWSFAEYENRRGFDMTNSPAIAKTWVYLVGVRSGSAQYLYVDGALVNASIVILPNNRDRDTTCDLTFGRATITPPGPDYFFKGKIDEARLQNRAVSADWIRLCYMNQKADNPLVVFNK
jgi:hypothetical protein